MKTLPKQKIIVSVISDLVTDQRVQKECNTLHKGGYEILLIGRKSDKSFGLIDLPYNTIRFKNFFAKGPLMYLHFNIQLFFFLLINKAHILWANDLDTLLPNCIIARIKNIKLVYDSHEYFTMSVPKKTSRIIWTWLEEMLFPRLKNVITVNDSIKDVYAKKYHVPLTVLRNVPYKATENTIYEQLPSGKKILIMQGIGINENRGAEEAVLTMKYLDNSYHLYFIGRGTIVGKLKEMTVQHGLDAKITFIDVLPYNQMMAYTRQCFLGLIFERIDHNEEHLFALPNKFFDYLKAGIPVLSSKAIEIKKIVEEYNVGDFIDNFEPKDIAEKIISIAKDESIYHEWKINTAKAANKLCWENEEIKLLAFMKNLQ